MVAGHKLHALIEVERHSEAKMDFRLNDNSNNHTHLDLAGLPDKGGGDLMAVGCWCLCSETGDKSPELSSQRHTNLCSWIYSGSSQGQLGRSQSSS